jgi:uncharacterized protein (TIGR02453 family)
MNKRKIFDFLRDLRENNAKEWMDANRERYHEAKAIWLDEVALYLERLRKHDPKLIAVEPKGTIMRINNNNVFHPDKPTYKDSFGFDPHKGMNRPSFYLHVSPSGSFIAGGLWHPDRDQLKKVREAIDYDGQKLKLLMEQAAMQEFFGGFDADPDALKTSPRDYDIEHRHIDLLRRKNFTVMREVTQEEVLADDFIDTVERGFLTMQPMLAYLELAINFEQ